MKTNFVSLLAAFSACCFLASPASAQVNPGDTFSIGVTGFNSSGGGGFLVGPLSGIFGSTQTFANAGLGGQTVTITSSQSTIAGFVVSTIMLSVPTNFIPVGTTIGGSAVTSVFLEIGGFNVGPNTLDYQNPLTLATFSGTATFGANSTIALTPTVQLSNGNRSLAVSEGVNAGGADLAPFAVRSFSFTSRVAAAVPDSGETVLLLGASFAAIVLLRRRFAPAQG